MNLRENRVSIVEVKKEILESVKRGRNLTPSEIVRIVQNIFPSHSHYEIKFLVKEMQRENELVNDIIYGGLRAA